MNGYMGQLQGPFQANEELYTRIKESCIEKMDSICHLGIQTITGDKVVIEINNKEIEIGKTGMYEVRDTEITSIKFKMDVDANTILDYTINIKIDD